MVLHICYNNTCFDLPTRIKEICPNNIKIETYDETLYKEKKKAYKIKGGYSARMTPFMLLTNNKNKYIKAFYSEDNKCNVVEFNKFIESVNLNTLDDEN